MARYADFSGRPPGAANLKAAGFVGVIRYAGPGSEGKQIHRAEWADYLRVGLDVLLIAELGTSDAWASLDDYATGRARAQLLLDDAAAEAPPGVDISHVRMACAADAHASSASQISDAVQYSRGFASVVGLWRSGFYGFSETSRAVHDAGTASWHWRCGSRPSVEEQKWVNFWQRNDGRVTVNTTMCDINETYAPLAPQEDDMTPDQARTQHNLDRLVTALLTDTDDVTQVVNEKGETVSYPLMLAQRVRALEARPTITLTDDQLDRLVDRMEQRGIGVGATVADVQDLLNRTVVTGPLQVRSQPL